LTDTHDGHDATADIKVERGTEVEDEEDPLLISSPDIKTEPEVSFTYLLTPWSRVLEKLTSKLCS
jgi:hypothetical protein